MREPFSIAVNGRTHRVRCDRETPLLYVLRNDLGLMGTRFGCGLGLCGACNVLVDGRPVHSCDTPVWTVGDSEVTTVEAFGTAQQPSRLQQSLLDHQAAQCGFCLSGIVITATALLRQAPNADEAAVRSALDGNLCRCGSHNRIVRAILASTEAMPANPSDVGRAQ
jgi:nicotinate dehydrogenase subunit A